MGAGLAEGVIGIVPCAMPAVLGLALPGLGPYFDCVWDCGLLTSGFAVRVS
jgi:hypothetical protein